MEYAPKVAAALILAGMSVMPTAIYGLFHTDSWTFQVTRFVFSLA